MGKCYPFLLLPGVLKATGSVSEGHFIFSLNLFSFGIRIEECVNAEASPDF